MRRLAWLATLPLLVLPLTVLAADGYTTGNVNLRAGPDTSYPRLDTLPAGAPVDIQGCTSGWEWCDVVFQGERGWVAGNFIQYQYQNQDVLVPQYGAQIGIPIVTFVIQTYWDNYYRNRPFYRERQRWYGRPMPHRPPPRPMYRPAPPHHHGMPYRPTPSVRPSRPLPDRHPQPMPQRPHVMPRPNPGQLGGNSGWNGHDAGRPQGNARPAPTAGHGAPGSHGRPTERGESRQHDKDQHDH
ncbi:SH3 domain-containing protein [Rhodanobacter glycinis]|uniref:Uncharacterized conserved protein YraI n=1 Tax=Rhodanobacter glycinis TaxID=582702 RepID=A0A1I3XLL7_9GAMM|nr:SH3 domain-containing protein [Rhodanobacter glycinis]SFK20239.1 Uncharacterized conserved protein YraI [Rhodanobacter glycinis]